MIEYFFTFVVLNVFHKILLYLLLTFNPTAINDVVEHGLISGKDWADSVAEPSEDLDNEFHEAHLPYSLECLPLL